MIKTKNGLFAGLILVSFLFPKLIYCHEEQNLAELRKTIKNQSLDEIADYLYKTDNWPKIISAEAREKLALEEQQIQKEAYKLAEDFFGKIKEFEKQNSRLVDMDSSSKVIDSYAKIGKVLRNKKGYINLVLTDTVYRLALSRIGFIIMYNTDQYEHASRLWEKLERPFYDVANISDFFSEEIGAENAKNKMANYSRSLWRGIDGMLSEDLKKRGFENFSVDDPSKIISTGYLMETMDPHTLFSRRMIHTDVMLEISVPGMVEFLKRGGKIGDLPKYTQDVRPFVEIMKESKKLQSKLSGGTGPFPSHLKFLHQFSESLSDSSFYRANVR